MIQLSYSTLRMVQEASHNWLNKVMGMKPEDRHYYKEGKDAHNIIQMHVSGRKYHPDLGGLAEEMEGNPESKQPIRFPIVEETDFDKNCKFEFSLKETIEFYNKQYTEPLRFPMPRDDYSIIGYFDGKDPFSKRFLEIKSSSTMWPITKFFNSPQRKIYALAEPEYKELVAVTCPRDVSLWKTLKPKVYKIPLTPRDRTEAIYWILDGIKIIESGDYTGGLDEDGKCRNFRCYYGVNCQFK